MRICYMRGLSGTYLSNITRSDCTVAFYFDQSQKFSYLSKMSPSSLFIHREHIAYNWSFSNFKILYFYYTSCFCKKQMLPFINIHFINILLYGLWFSVQPALKRKSTIVVRTDWRILADLSLGNTDMHNNSILLGLDA